MKAFISGTREAQSRLAQMRTVQQRPQLSFQTRQKHICVLLWDWVHTLA